LDWVLIGLLDAIVMGPRIESLVHHEPKLCGEVEEFGRFYDDCRYSVESKRMVIVEGYANKR
jgi:hypothetical protein